MAEGAPAGEDGEHDAAENRFVINIGAAAEEKDGAAETDVDGEKHGLPGGRPGAVRAQQAGRVEEQEIGADERRGVIEEQGGAAELAEGEAEDHEGQAEQRGREAEVAVDFSAVDEGFAL